MDNSWTHPKYKDNCESYISGKSMKYACTDKDAMAACCSCKDEAAEKSDSGAVCMDKKKKNGDNWHDSVDPKYDCSWYVSLLLALCSIGMSP
jgi:hypothetical protein